MARETLLNAYGALTRPIRDHYGHLIEERFVWVHKWLGTRVVIASWTQRLQLT